MNIHTQVEQNINNEKWTLLAASRMAGKSRKSVNNKKIICAQCRMEVKEETEDSIECDKCCKVFHVMCTKLDKRQYDQLLKNCNEEFVCHLCVGNDGGAYTVELQRIDAKLNKIDQLTEAMNFMSSKFDEMIKGVSENKKKINCIEKENQKLKNEVKTLKESVKFLSDQRVKNDCIVIGVDVKEGATAAETIIDVSKNIGIEIKKNCIEDAYFLKQRNQANAKQNLVVKFNVKSEKDKLMESKMKFKECENTKSVYVNDFLSKESLELLNYAKTLKTVGYHSVYSHGGRIYVKKSPITKPRFIKCADDVDNMLIEASTNKFQHRRSARHEVVTLPDSELSDDGNKFESPEGK